MQPNTHNISGSDVLYDSQDAYFLMKNNTNEAATFDVSLYEGADSLGSGTISSWSNVSSINLGKLSAGTHTFTLQTAGKTICSVSLTVKEESMECSVEDLNGNKINSIDMGQTYVLKWICIQQDPNSFGGNYSKNGSYVGGASCSNGICSVTTSENSPGSFVYTLNTWNCNSSACTNTININDVAPAITCPDNMTKSVGSTVSVTPKSLSGCASGCSYTIDGTSASGSDYTGGAISFAGASYAVTETYTFNVSNSKGERASCSFNVEYSEGSTCSSSDWIIGQWDSNKHIDGTFTGACYEFNTSKACSSVQVHASGSGEILVNGQRRQCSYSDSTVPALSVIKLEVPDGCTVTKLYVSNCN